MPRYEITAPTGQRFEVNAPDGATEQEVMAYAQKQFGQTKPAPDRPVDPTEGMSGTQQFLAGMGKEMVDLGRGAGQMLGLVDQKSVDEARQRDIPLMNTGAGMAGNIAGGLVTAVPALAIPGANTIAGASLLGAAQMGLQPVASGESRLQNAALGAVTGGAAQYGLGKVSQIVASRLANAESQGAKLASQNAGRDAVLKASQDAGYVIPPSMAESGLASRILEGVSGKYKTNQLATIKNANVTERLSKKALGIAEDQPLTIDAVKGVRADAFDKGYAPVAKAGTITTDSTYDSALTNLAATNVKAARSFPEAVKDEITPIMDSMRVKEFDAGDAIAMTRYLRDKAGTAFADDNKDLGRAYAGASDALENQIERGLAAKGEDGAALLKNFRDARTLMAKSFDVEKALIAGNGRPDSRVYAAALRKGKPLTDELAVAGNFAKHYKDVAGVPQSGFANPFTIMDFGFGTATGSPILPMARVAARYGILSKPFQKAAVGPSYGPGLLTRNAPDALEEMRRLGLGGLLGPSVYAAQ